MKRVMILFFLIFFSQLVSSQVDNITTDAYIKIMASSKIYETGEEILLKNVEEPKIVEEQLISSENKQLDQSLKEDLFIVELKEESLIEFKSNVEDEISIREERLHNSDEVYRYTVGLVDGISIAYSKARINSNINKQNEAIEEEHDRVKEELNKVAKTSVVVEYKNTFNGMLVSAEKEELVKLFRLDEIEKIYPNSKVKANLKESVPLISADDVWLLDNDGNLCGETGKDCITGKNIRISIIDTGVDYTHPDLGGCFGNGCKVEGGYDFVNEDNNPIDDYGHGTHVAGIAAGNGTLKGTAPDAIIYAYKALDSSGSGYASDIISSIEKSVDPNGDGDFSDHLDVISMSLGGSGDPDSPLSKSVDNAVKNGVVAVISAGNSGPAEMTIGDPGTARKAITVGAIDKSKNLAGFSSRGPVIWSNGTIIKPDILAPGVSICSVQYNNYVNDSLCIDDEHIQISGTSMSAPHVSGIVALLLQKNPDWTPDQIKHAIRTTASDRQTDMNAYGYGIVDALRAISLVNPPPVVEVYTNDKALGVINLKGKISSNKFNRYEVYLIKLDDPSSLISIYNSNTSPNGEILVSDFDTRNYPDGTYLLRVIVYNSDGVSSEDNSVISIDNVGFISPKNYQYLNVLSGGLIEIKSTITNENVRSYSVDYSLSGGLWKNEGITIPQSITNKVIALWNISGFNIGSYDLRLTATLNSGYIEEEKIKVILVSGDLSSVGNFHLNSPVISDLDNNGEKEIIITAKGATDLGGGFIVAAPGRLIILNDNTEIINYWDLKNNKATDWIQSPTIADINNDGIKEIMLGLESGYVHVWDLNGVDMEGWPLKLEEGYVKDSTPLVAYDVDNDNELEIIVPAAKWLGQGRVYIFENDGKPVTGWPKIVNVYHPTSPAVGDIDGDGVIEIVVAGGNHYSEKFGMVYVWKSNGSLMQGWPRNIGSAIFSSPSLADIDNDNNLEIIFGDYNGRVHAFNYDGSYVSGWPVSLESSGTIRASPAIGNIDNDNELEIAIHSCHDQKVYLFNGDGSLMPGWPQFLGGTCIDSVSLGDVNSDGEVDIVGQAVPSGAGQEGRVISWNNDGSIISDFPISLGNAYPTSAVIDDLDKDGNVDIIMGIVNNDNLVSFIYRLERDKTFNADSLHWPMYGHDVQHTGLYIPPRPSLCGNGAIDEGEKCDDGNKNSNDACSAQCKFTICGDGIVQSPNGNNVTEDCDDGNDSDADNCPASCLFDEDKDNVNYKNDCNEFSKSIGQCTGCAVCSVDFSLSNNNGTCIASDLNACGAIYCPSLPVCGDGGCKIGELAVFEKYQEGSCVVSGNHGSCSEPKCIADSCTANSACLTDQDGDGVPDAQDKCPIDNFGGYDKQNIFGLPRPEMSSFNLELSTNLSRENLESVDNFTFNKQSVGKIKFPSGNTVPLIRKSNGTCVPLEFEEFIRIEPGLIELKGNDMPELDVPARLTFESIIYSNPQILKDGNPCTDCTIISYGNGELIVDVSGFSIYTVIEGSSSGSGGSSGGPGGGGGGSSGGSSKSSSIPPSPEKIIDDTLPIIEEEIFEEVDETAEIVEEYQESINLAEIETNKSQTRNFIIVGLIVLLLIILIFIFARKYNRKKDKISKMKKNLVIILIGFTGLTSLLFINFPITGSIIQEISCENCDGILPYSYIYNKGPSNLTGHILIKVQLLEEGKWSDIKTIFKDKEERVISPNSFINLNEAWWNTGGFSSEVIGNFRIYAEFSDKNGSIILSSNGPLNYSSEFEVVFNDNEELTEEELSDSNLSESNSTSPYTGCKNCLGNITLPETPSNGTLQEQPTNGTETEQEEITPDCTDTDGGRNYNIKGSTDNNKKNQHGNDYCESGYPSTYNLLEYFCNSEGNFQSEGYLCLNGCSNGACIGGNEAVYPVVSSPYDCTDTDGTTNYGKDYYKSGSATSKGGIGGSDFCVEGNSNFNLIEYFCPSQAQAARIGYKCPNGCSNGACV